MKKIEQRLFKLVNLGNNQNGTVTSIYIPYQAGERTAQCSCGRQSFSQSDLPFFKQEPEQSRDKYYCGCRGWD